MKIKITPYKFEVESLINTEASPDKAVKLQVSENSTVTGFLYCPQKQEMAFMISGWASDFSSGVLDTQVLGLSLVPVNRLFDPSWYSIGSGFVSVQGQIYMVVRMF